MSTIAATATSDWPTPTVSTNTVSNPAASHSSSASRVRRATPPSVPRVGDGRTKACGERVSCSMRVLSPRIEPPLRVLDGSTASTATRWPSATTCSPSASMKVDLPAPGAPEMPMRIAAPVCGKHLREQRFGFFAVVGTRRLHERDRTRQRAAVAVDHLARELGHVVGPLQVSTRP